MAMTKRNAIPQAFNPTWPELSSLSANHIRFTYDRPTDTLFVDFYGDARPAASVALERGNRDYLFLRVDPETDAVVGLQIEHFLSYAVMQHPELALALDVASLVDVGRDDVDRIARIRSGRTAIGNAVTLIEVLRRLSA
jgi:hypothetical protein